jgi:hypothetical protein
MQLGETIATYDVGLALRGESGKFEVTSPAGEIYRVTCQANYSISNLEWSGNTTNPQPFLIRKVAEPVYLEPGKGAASAKVEAAAPTPIPRFPFLLEIREENAKSSSGGPAAMLPAQDNLQSSENVNLDLLYLEVDPSTNHPSACVGLRSSQPDHAIKAEMLTLACTSFNELDAEIRRLHAQLDEIRYQARKKFYQAHAAAASA